MSRRELFDAMSALYAYPEPGYASRVERCIRLARLAAPDTAAELARFEQKIAGMPVEALQEQFTLTFDLNPACALDLGWHLFGEQYERGEFLVKMRRLLRHLNVRESVELPDHLTHVLAALGRMAPEEAEEFAAACLFPAMDKIRESLPGENAPFSLLFQATTRLLEEHFPRPVAVPAGMRLPVWNGRSFQ